MCGIVYRFVVIESPATRNHGIFGFGSELPTTRDLTLTQEACSSTNLIEPRP